MPPEIDDLPAPQRPPSRLDAPANKRADRAFKGATQVAGLVVFLIIIAIFVFLVLEARPALTANTTSFWTTKVWFPDQDRPTFGVAALVFGTILTSVLALVMAVPVAFGIAIYITEFAPRRLASLLGYLTDLLAAVPSVVFGLWAISFLLKHMGGLQTWLNTYLGFIPLFHGSPPPTFSKSVMNASIVLAVMVLPIVSAIAREVLRQVDPGLKESALALGATRWEMVRVAVLPPSRGGLISAVILGLGRALGETIAIALVIGGTFTTSWFILPPGGNTIAANIAVKYAEAQKLGVQALIASGLVLFAITLVVNFIARWIVSRSGSVQKAVI